MKGGDWAGKWRGVLPRLKGAPHDIGYPAPGSRSGLEIGPLNLEEERKLGNYLDTRFVPDSSQTTDNTVDSQQTRTLFFQVPFRRHFKKIFKTFTVSQRFPQSWIPFLIKHPGAHFSSKLVLLGI